MIKKTLILVLIMFLASTGLVQARDNEAGQSGKLVAFANASSKPDDRVRRLKEFLEAKNSPCALFSEEFVALADKYGLDWKLGPAISGIESSFCQVYPVNYNNPFGIAGGYYYFKSLPDSIEYLNNLIATNPYYQKFQQTGNMEDLAVVYCELPQKWLGAVSRFMNEIEYFSLSTTSYLTISL